MTEPVALGPLPVVRLECSLHPWPPRRAPAPALSSSIEGSVQAKGSRRAPPTRGRPPTAVQQRLRQRPKLGLSPCAPSLRRCYGSAPSPGAAPGERVPLPWPHAGAAPRQIRCPGLIHYLWIRLWETSREVAARVPNAEYLWGACVAVLRNELPDGAGKTWLEAARPWHSRTGGSSWPSPARWPRNASRAATCASWRTSSPNWPARPTRSCSKSTPSWPGPRATTSWPRPRSQRRRGLRPGGLGRRRVRRRRQADGGSVAAGRPVAALPPRRPPVGDHRHPGRGSAAQPVHQRRLRRPGRDRPQPNYTFDDFVIGESNRFAAAAALAVAEQPAVSYNPLFIYGDAGLGKTHLLHAIGHYVRANYPGMCVRYVSTEHFLNDFIEAIRTNSQGAFKLRYRRCDVLLVDDVQLIENKATTQEEFFHTFDYLHSAGRQIVISSDRPPKAMATLEDRLRSRFGWGLITDVQPPAPRDPPRHPAQEGRPASPPRPPTTSSPTSPPTSPTTSASSKAPSTGSWPSPTSTGSPSTLDMAESVLGDLITAKAPRQITAKLVIEATADMFGLTVDELCGKSRSRPLVTARQVGHVRPAGDDRLQLPRHRTGLRRPRPHHGDARGRPRSPSSCGNGARSTSRSPSSCTASATPARDLHAWQAVHDRWTGPPAPCRQPARRPE